MTQLRTEVQLPSYILCECVYTALTVWLYILCTCIIRCTCISSATNAYTLNYNNTKVNMSIMHYKLNCTQTNSTELSHHRAVCMSSTFAQVKHPYLHIPGDHIPYHTQWPHHPGEWPFPSDFISLPPTVSYRSPTSRLAALKQWRIQGGCFRCSSTPLQGLPPLAFNAKSVLTPVVSSS